MWSQRMTTKPTLNACLRRKRLYFNRATVAYLGNPTHLAFGYDEKRHLLYVFATVEDDRNAFTIPKYYWNSSGSCVVARIAFLTALQYRLRWEHGKKYSYAGEFAKIDGHPAIVFKMTEGTIRKSELLQNAIWRCMTGRRDRW